MIFTALNAANWGDVGKEKEKGLFDFDFITWMAWTWPTASFFIFIALCITAMYFWEKKSTRRITKKRNTWFRHNKRRQIVRIFTWECIYSPSLVRISGKSLVDSYNYLCCLFHSGI